MSDDPFQFLSEVQEPSTVRRRCAASTQSGFGKRYYPAEPCDEDGTCIATKWQVAFGMPVWPISRDRILPRDLDERMNTQSPIARCERFTFDLHASERPRASEIVYTIAAVYLFKPLFVLCVPMLAVIAQTKFRPMVEEQSKQFHVPVDIVLTLITVAWLIGAFWEVGRWRSESLFGKSGK